MSFFSLKTYLVDDNNLWRSRSCDGITALYRVAQKVSHYQMIKKLY